MTEQTTSFLTPRELAVFLNESGVRVTEDRVRGWLKDGKVPSVMLPGSNRRIVRREVAEGILRGDYGGTQPHEPSIPTT